MDPLREGALVVRLEALDLHAEVVREHCEAVVDVFERGGAVEDSHRRHPGVRWSRGRRRGARLARGAIGSGSGGVSGCCSEHTRTRSDRASLRRSQRRAEQRRRAGLEQSSEEHGREVARLGCHHAAAGRRGVIGGKLANYQIDNAFELALIHHLTLDRTTVHADPT
eukprot:5507033-Prymnesium_polylepis.2